MFFFGKKNQKAFKSAVENKDFGWFKDLTLKSVQIKEEYFDKNYYSVLSPGADAIYGIVYSKPNKAIYYTNASDGYLYTVDTVDIQNAQIGSYLSDISKQIENISCGDGQTFSNFGNGLGYNMFANTLYLKFANEKTIAIVFSFC